MKAEGDRSQMNEREGDFTWHPATLSASSAGLLFLSTLGWRQPQDTTAVEWRSLETWLWGSAGPQTN